MFCSVGSVLDSRKCFVVWEVFWILGSVFGLGLVFWILGSVLSLWATIDKDPLCQVKSQWREPIQTAVEIKVKLRLFQCTDPSFFNKMLSAAITSPAVRI